MTLLRTLLAAATLAVGLHSAPALAEKSRDADVSAVYYAGHGMEVGGVNFLIPVDARLKTDRDATFEAIPLDLAGDGALGSGQDLGDLATGIVLVSQF